jgi:hypothetical protein
MIEEGIIYFLMFCGIFLPILISFILWEYSEGTNISPYLSLLSFLFLVIGISIFFHTPTTLLIIDEEIKRISLFIIRANGLLLGISLFSILLDKTKISKEHSDNFYHSKQEKLIPEEMPESIDTEKPKFSQKGQILDLDDLIKLAQEKLGLKIEYRTICQSCKNPVEFSDLQKETCPFCSYKLSPRVIMKMYVLTDEQGGRSVLDRPDIIEFLEKKFQSEERISEKPIEQEENIRTIANVVGKTCPYCQTPIKPEIPVIICPECGIPHHRECWEENAGCTTYGCRYARPR